VLAPSGLRGDPIGLYLIPYTLLGGAPHPPDPPGLKIHAKLNFQKIPRPNWISKKFRAPIFFLIQGGSGGVRSTPWQFLFIKIPIKTLLKLRIIYKSLLKSLFFNRGYFPLRGSLGPLGPRSRRTHTEMAMAPLESQWEPKFLPQKGVNINFYLIFKGIFNGAPGAPGGN